MSLAECVRQYIGYVTRNNKKKSLTWLYISDSRSREHCHSPSSDVVCDKNELPPIIPLQKSCYPKNCVLQDLSPLVHSLHHRVRKETTLSPTSNQVLIAVGTTLLLFSIESISKPWLFPMLMWISQDSECDRMIKVFSLSV